MRNTIIKTLTLSSVLLGCCFFSTAQEVDKDTLLPKDRWALKVNTIDMLATVPNLGFEYDLGNTVFAKNTLGVALRYRPELNKSIKTYNVMSLAEIRPEFRHYRRGYKETNKILYYGGYMSGALYSLKLSDNGEQGWYAGLGGTVGFVTPLYEYKKIAIDLEVGASLGLAINTATAFTLSEDHRAYVTLPDQGHGVKFVPFPVVSELRVAFAFRGKSSKHKYKLTSSEASELRKKAMNKEDK